MCKLKSQDMKTIKITLLVISLVALFTVKNGTSNSVDCLKKNTSELNKSDYGALTIRNKSGESSLNNLDPNCTMTVYESLIRTNEGNPLTSNWKFIATLEPGEYIKIEVYDEQHKIIRVSAKRNPSDYFKQYNLRTGMNDVHSILCPF